MKHIIQPVKGTRDYYPEDMASRSWLYQSIRQVSTSFGYQEWEAPMLETIELYAAKSGEELVSQESTVSERDLLTTVAGDLGRSPEDFAAGFKRWKEVGPKARVYVDLLRRVQDRIKEQREAEGR